MSIQAASSHPVADEERRHDQVRVKARVRVRVRVTLRVKVRVRARVREGWG